jgi:hypothetical protein
MARHKDLITKLATIANGYTTSGSGWWENQGIDLEEEPDWAWDSIMLVSWPEHVLMPHFNGDCTISGPYASVADAKASAADDAEIDL